MSQENEEVARRMYVAYNAGDWDTIRHLMDPNATLRTAEGFQITPRPSEPWSGGVGGVAGERETTAGRPDVLAVFVEGFECYNRHDFDAMEALYAPDAVSDFSRVFLDEQPRRGRKEIRAFWDQMWDTSGGMSIHPVEVLDVGDGRYVVVVAFGMRGKRSGVDVAERQAVLYTLRENKVARLDVFPDRDAALKAVGPEE